MIRCVRSISRFSPMAPSVLTAIADFLQCVPVKVGGLTIKPGDLIHGDCNGVTTIPIDIANKVAALCEHYVDAEAIILNYLKSDQVTPQGLGEALQECRRTLQQLADGLKQ